MGRPDALSQRSDHPRGKDDNTNVTLLPSDVFKVHNMEATLVDSRGDELVEHIQRSMDYDVSSKTVSWGLKLLCYPLCLQGSDTEEKGVPVKCN